MFPQSEGQFMKNSEFINVEGKTSGSDKNIIRNRMGSGDFIDHNLKVSENPRFPTFQNDEYIMSNEEQKKSLSFGKKFQNNQVNYFEGNSLYNRSEFFNFYGVLNFKVRKYNKRLLAEAFERIFETACDIESKMRIFVFGTLVKKDNLIHHLARLSTEINRRFNIKNQCLFKMCKNLNIKKKICLRMFKLMRSGNNVNMSRLSITDANTYVGKLLDFIIIDYISCMSLTLLKILFYETL